MKAKPKGPKYRNLYARVEVIYYERQFAGRTIKLSTATADWDLAASFRDRYEAHKGIARGLAPVDAPILADFAKRYQREDTAHLAPTTRSDRAQHLSEEGPLLPHLGALRLDAITPQILRDWWTLEVVGRKRTAATGRKYLATLAGLFGYAGELGMVESDPVAGLREQLRRRGRTQGARAASDDKIQPIEDPADVAKLVAASGEIAAEDFARIHRGRRDGQGKPRPLHDRTGGLRAHVAVLAMLDGGLRVGEVAGLTWAQVRWGDDEDDRRRALVIDRSRPRGGQEGPPKSGKRRVVAMSRRLRRALAQLYRLSFEPGPEAPVLPGFEPHNFGSRDWRQILKRAEIGHRRPKDLRDSFASHLLTAGIQLGWISAQLGHSNVAVTATHYARWCGGDLYHEALTLEPGEVPPDLLARLQSHQSPTSSLPAVVHEDEIRLRDEHLMVAQARIELATPAFSEGRSSLQGLETKGEISALARSRGKTRGIVTESHQRPTKPQAP